MDDTLLDSLYTLRLDFFNAHAILAHNIQVRVLLLLYRNEVSGC